MTIITFNATTHALAQLANRQQIKLIGHTPRGGGIGGSGPGWHRCEITLEPGQSFVPRKNGKGLHNIKATLDDGRQFKVYLT